MQLTDSLSFGKYRGRSLKTMLSDKAYCYSLLHDGIMHYLRPKELAIIADHYDMELQPASRRIHSSQRQGLERVLNVVSATPTQIKLALFLFDYRNANGEVTASELQLSHLVEEDEDITDIMASLRRFGVIVRDENCRDEWNPTYRIARWADETIIEKLA